MAEFSSSVFVHSSICGAIEASGLAGIIFRKMSEFKS